MAIAQKSVLMIHNQLSGNNIFYIAKVSMITEASQIIVRLIFLIYFSLITKINMKYKTVTTKEIIKVMEEPHTSSIEEIQVYLNEGYKLINASASHQIRPDLTAGDFETRPTMIFIVTTYFLSKEEGMK